MLEHVLREGVIAVRVAGLALHIEAMLAVVWSPRRQRAHLPQGSCGITTTRSPTLTLPGWATSTTSPAGLVAEGVMALAGGESLPLGAHGGRVHFHHHELAPRLRVGDVFDFGPPFADDRDALHAAAPAM